MHEVPAGATRPRPSFSPGYQVANLGRQQAPPTEDETWTVEELTLLSMIHRRDRKILDLKQENQRLEMLSLQQEQQLKEITARVKELEGKFVELQSKAHYGPTDEVFEEGRG